MRVLYHLDYKLNKEVKIIPEGEVNHWIATQEWFMLPHHGEEYQLLQFEKQKKQLKNKHAKEIKQLDLAEKE